MTTTERVNLFVYGTLMFREVWEHVVGPPFYCEPATLRGFVVRRVARDVYPVLVSAEANDRARGLVMRDIAAHTLAKLDDYESDLYDRVEVIAELASGEALECQAYVLPDRNRRHASGELWSAREFADGQLAAYLKRLH